MGIDHFKLILCSFRRFLVGEKTTSLFSFGKEKRVLFLCVQEKNEKKPQACGLTVCAADSGSVAAIKDGVHAREARVIRQSPPFSSISCRMALTRRAPCACGRRLPTAVASRTANVGLPSEARANNCWEPWVCASQQMNESPRRIVSVSLLVLFSSVRKAQLFYKISSVIFITSRMVNGESIVPRLTSCAA